MKSRSVSMCSLRDGMIINNNLFQCSLIECERNSFSRFNEIDEGLSTAQRSSLLV